MDEDILRETRFIDELAATPGLAERAVVALERIASALEAEGAARRGIEAREAELAAASREERRERMTKVLANLPALAHLFQEILGIEISAAPVPPAPDSGIGPRFDD